MAALMRLEQDIVRQVTAINQTNSSDGSGPDDGLVGQDQDRYNWSFICVLVFVVAGTLGNILVCLAVSLERPLQNVTNWFLVSLAFADLIVSTIVMPFGAAAGFLGIMVSVHSSLAFHPPHLITNNVIFSTRTNCRNTPSNR